MSKRTKPVEVYAEIEDVVRRRDAIPSDQDLADRTGFSRAYIQQLMHRIRKTIGKKADVSCGTNLSDTNSQTASNCEPSGGQADLIRPQTAKA